MQYSAKSIKHLAKLDHIRKRPTGYIVDTGVRGQFHIIKEILDNSIDELVNHKEASKLTVFMYRNLRRKTYQIVVIDDGRGIPFDSLIDVFTNPNTSGKFDTDSYKFSAGTFGVGAKATTALSKHFRAITFRYGKIGDVYLHHTNIPETITVSTGANYGTGTAVIFEPDPTIFSDIGEFLTSEHRLITEFLSKASVFADYHIYFKILNKRLPFNLKKTPAEDILNTLMSEQGPYDFDSSMMNRDLYLREFFRLNKPFEVDLRSSFRSTSLEVDMELKSVIFSTSSNNKLTFVNGVPFTDGSNMHIKMVFDEVKERLCSHLDIKMHPFFKQVYRIPLWLVMNIKFKGAQFSGTTKHLFVDVKFKPVFTEALKELITDEHISTLYSFLKDHIETAYNRYTNKGVTLTSNLALSLNRPDKFFDCNTSDRSKAELFLIEGDSAKSDQGRDSEHQGSYLLSGKPQNSLVAIGKEFDSIEKLKKNKIYQDIIRIIGITPGSNDLSNLNFWKIFLTTDADVHGYHIANILLSNLYLLCPALVEEGHVYVVIPPLYSIKMKRGKDTYYVKDQEELIATLANYLYYNAVDVYLKSPAYAKTKLSRKEYIAFTEIVFTVGELIANLSVEYSIPPVILEQLSLLTHMLGRSLTENDTMTLKDMFGCDVRYNSGGVLVFDIAGRDVIVPLNSIKPLIYENILPVYRSIEYGKLEIYITTKYGTLRDTRVTIVQLYQLFKEMDKLFDIKRNKGLGSMHPKDRSITCINPETRRTYQVTSIGDLEVVYGSMGNNSEYRKNIILS